MNEDNQTKASWTNRFALTKPGRFGNIPNPRGILTWATIATATIVVAMFVGNGLHSIDSTERGVVSHRDGSLGILAPGKFQWVTPILNTVYKYDVRDVAYTKSAVGISLDLQETTTEITVLYHPDPLAIQTIHQTLGGDYEAKVVAPAVQGCVKNAVSFFNVEQLTGATRAKVAGDVRDCIQAQMANNHLVVNTITMTDFDFSKAFNDAIEAKAVAQQKAQEERNRLEQVRYQANQTIVQATAQAEAARLLSQSTSGQQGATYVCLKFLEKWDGKLPLYGGGGIPCGSASASPFAAPTLIMPAPGANP